MNTTTALTDAEASSIIALILGLGALAIVLGIILYVLYIIANWKIFTKAGEAGWKSIIPFYNAYIQFKISWKTSMFWIFLILIIVGSILTAIDPDNNILIIIGGIVMIVGCVIALISEFYLCKSFGKGAGFFVGMLITSFFGLGWIFNLVLGFGSAQYIGNGSEIK